MGDKFILKIKDILMCAALPAVLLFMGVFFDCSLCYAQDETVYLNAGGNINREISVDPIGRYEGYSAVLYDNTNGLPTSEANAITETEDGFIWIGSYAGLIRYDGNIFERMDSTEGLTSIKCLYVDSRDRLWIGTNDNGVAVMEKGKLRRWSKLDGMKSAHTRAIAEDTNGNIYIATACGVAMIDPQYNLTSIDDPDIAEADMRDIRSGNDGAIYGATDLGDVVVIRDGKLSNYISIEENPLGGVGTIFPDPLNPGMIYHEAVDFCFYHVDLNNGFEVLEKIDIDPLKYIKSMEYIDGRIWICAGNGIGVLKNGSFSLLENVPVNNNVGHVMTDYLGNLWFTSTRQGVMKIVPNQFTDLFARYKLDPAVVNATCMVDGKLFGATDTGLLVFDEKGPVSAMPLKSAVTASGVSLEYDDLITMMEGTRIRSIVRDSKDRLWISTWRSMGLVRYDHGDVKVFAEEEGLYSDSIRCVSECSDGRFLVALTGGVSVIKDDLVIRSYGKEDGIDNTESLTVTEGVDGDIILGSNGGGIYILDDNGLKKTINVEEGLPSDIVMRLKWDKAHELIWVVTSSAVAYMTPDYQVTTVHKFPYPNNFDLYESDNSDVWILSSNGIYVTPKEELVANGEINPVFFGIASGLSCITTANSYSELTDDGDLYIAGSTGICKVNIDEPFDDVNELKAVVPYVDADGVVIYPDESGTITIPSTTHKLTVSGFVYNYSLSDPKVSYRLEGFDSEVTTVNRNDLMPVVYTNLRGGTYYFEMQLKDSLGRGNKDVLVKIVKEKAFYERTWFYLLIGVLGISLLALVVKLYINTKMQKLEKKQKEEHDQFAQTCEALANAIDAKDKYTNGHSRRVAKYSRAIAEAAGKSVEECDKVSFAALLHDVGKIGVPMEILAKNGKLTDEEFEQIKQHPVVGGQILSSIKQSPWLSTGAKYHHEKYNGTGYPEGKKGENIPEIARIIAVADAYDAMTSNRSYRNAIPQHIVREELVKGSGTQFDPKFAKIMVSMLDQDTDYKMQESATGINVTSVSGLRCDSIYEGHTDGIVITGKKTRISLCSQPDSAVPEDKSLPTLIVYDSLDTRVHPGEEDNKKIMYLEYAKIRMDGKLTEGGVRKSDVRNIEQTSRTNSGMHEPGQLYVIETFRNKDHVLVRVTAEKKAFEVILALPDTARYAYISITGENCEIHNIRVDSNAADAGTDEIPRIAEEISYIKDCPVGDIPNVQVDGPRGAVSEGVPIKNGFTFKFHSRSYPTARLVWHCPYVNIFASADGSLKNANVRDLFILRMDGESWEHDDRLESEVQVVRKDEFVGWEEWKERNRQGIDCTVTISREKNSIIIETENMGLALRSVVTVRDNVNDLYAALTGDQCILTDIHVLRD